MMAQFSLPIKTKRHSIANLLACTRSDYNAIMPALAPFFHASIWHLPETKTTATPIAISCYYQRRRPGALTRIMHFLFLKFRNGRKIGAKEPSPHRKTGSMIRNANLIHLPQPISQLHHGNSLASAIQPTSHSSELPFSTTQFCMKNLTSLKAVIYGTIKTPFSSLWRP